MSATRGRNVIIGGVQVEPAGYGGRVNENLLTRPAYRYSGGGQIQPIPASLGFGHPLLDLGQVGAWRLITVGLAVAYVVGFHVMLGRTRLGIGPRG